MILSSLSGADNIMVLDSNNLPQGWRDANLCTLFTKDHDPVLDHKDKDQDVRRPSNPGVQPIFYTTMDKELERSRDALVPQVLIFTTLHLIGLLTLCKRASVNGTFWSITRFWKQIFILMAEYQGVHIPIALAWLPDKSAMSYYVFLWLILNCF